jgi:hypothetical protein
MFIALSYKEWLKTRWVLLAAIVLGITSILTIFLNLGAIAEFNDANAVWNYVVYKKYLFYGDIKFVPAIIGFIFAVAQFYSEANNLRLKLTLHLPLNENKLLFYMLGYGTLMQFILDIIFVLFLSVVTSHFFPSEIVASQFYTVLPWIFSGFVTYFFVSAIMVDPLWPRRVILLLAAYEIISFYLITNGYQSYMTSMYWFIVIGILEFFLIFLSGFRFKRGAR